MLITTNPDGETMDFGSDYMQLAPGEYLDVYFQAQPGSVFILGLPSASLGAINPPSVTMDRPRS